MQQYGTRTGARPEQDAPAMHAGTLHRALRFSFATKLRCCIPISRTHKHPRRGTQSTTGNIPVKTLHRIFLVRSAFCLQSISLAIALQIDTDR